jgi:hypothetical protein
LAGYALERFTRDSNDEVVNAVSRVFGRKKGNAAEKPKPGVSAVQNFATWQNRMYQRRSERNISFRQ